MANSNCTYADLIEYLSNIPKERLNDSVTIFVSGLNEFYTLDKNYPILESDNSCDILDEGHVYFKI